MISILNYTIHFLDLKHNDHNDTRERKQPTTAQPTRDHANTQKNAVQVLKVALHSGCAIRTMTHNWSKK